MRAGVLLMLVGAAACEGKASKSGSPPSPAPPAPSDASAADACKRAAQDAITKSDIAISKALAAQQLELFAPQFLPTPFDEAPRGTGRALPDPAADQRRVDARAPFVGKHTGDVVTWRNGEQAVTGIYIEPAKEGWLIARKGTQIVVAKPATWREITCADPREYDGGCMPTGPTPLLFALPAGATFGGTLELPAERVTLRLTGGPPAPCPP